MNTNIRCFLVANLILLISISSYGDEDLSMDALFNLPLEELLTLNVRVASKSDDKFIDAPGTISVISKFELEGFGTQQLHQALNREASSQTVNGGRFFFNQVMVRGQSFQNWDRHSLFLINGRPIRNTQTKGLNRSLLSSLPMSIVDQVEVIRGPGSVLYGTNAYSSVINVRTDIGENDTHWATASVGDFNSQGVEFGSRFRHNEVKVLFNMKLTDKGFDSINIGDINGEYRDQNFWQENRSLFLDVQYRGWHLTAIELENDTPYFSRPLSWRSGETQVSEFTDRFVNVGYKTTLSESEISFDITYNDNFWDDRFETDPSAGDSTLYELGLSGSLPFLSDSELNLRYVAGLSYESENFASQDLLSQVNTNYSAYFQTGFYLTSNVKMIAGIQWNDSELLSPDIISRLSFIWNVSDNSAIKGQYSEAYRAPSSVESSANIPGIFLGDPTVTPETIATSELQYIYQSKPWYISVNVFHSQLDDLIVLIDNPDGGRINANGDGADFKGIELELKTDVNDYFYLTGNASWIYSTVDIDDFNTAPAPESMLKLGGIYHKEKLRVGLHSSYFSTPPVFVDTLINPAPSSYVLSTLNIEYLLPELSEGSKVSLYVDNLFDEDIWFVEFSNRQLNSLPNAHRRSLLLNLTYSFQ